MKAAIITSSDSGYAGEREDKSGSVIQEIWKRTITKWCIPFFAGMTERCWQMRWLV